MHLGTFALLFYLNILVMWDMVYAWWERGRLSVMVVNHVNDNESTPGLAEKRRTHEY